MKRIVPLMALVLLLTGCKLRVDSKLVIGEDESGTYAIEMSVDQELRDLAESEGGEPIDFSEGFEDVPEGWTVEEFSDGEFEGARIERAFSDIAELRSELEVMDLGGEAATPNFFTGVTVEHEGDEFRFEADLTGISETLGDLTGEDLGAEGLEGFDAATLFENLFEMRLIVTLPGSIGDNNADEVSGNTLTWQIALDDEGTVIQAVSTVGGGGGSVVVIALVVLAGLVLLALGTVYLKGRRRKDQKESIDTAIVGEPDAILPEPATAGEAFEEVATEVEATEDAGEPAIGEPVQAPDQKPDEV